MEKIDRVEDPDGERKILELHAELRARRQFHRKFLALINAARLEPEPKQ